MTAENEEKDIKGVNKDASNKDTDISDEEMERDEEISTQIIIDRDLS